jgi:hypothetical protein
MTARFRIAAALALGSVLLLAAPAHAEDPVEISGAYVVDRVGVTGGDEERLLAAIDELYDATGVQLFVVYVDSFTGAADREQWADESATLSQLGDNDALLAIATEDRLYQISVAEGFPLSDADIADAETDALVPRLRDDEWSDAAIDFAGALHASQAAPSVPVAPILIVGGIAVVGGGSLLLLNRSRRRRRESAASGQPGQPSQKDLDQRAGTLLVQLDDSVKTSEQELGFAEAQFGEEATREFQAAVASAKAKVGEAFALRQRLDDAFPETDEEKLGMTRQIVDLCESADAELDAQADAFDALRELEKNAPAVLDGVDASVAALRSRLPAGTQALQQLSAQYAPTAIATVASNVAQATTIIGLAESASSTARSSIAAGSTGPAAVSARAAEAGVGQAKRLLDAIDTLAGGLARARTALDAAVAEVQRDLAEARAVAGSDLADVIQSTSGGLAAVLAEGSKDPENTLARVEQLDETLSRSLAAVRDRQAQVASARSSLDRVLASARSQISSGEDYLATRRGGVGTDARTRFSSARAALDEAVALAGADPVSALASGQRALSLAQEGTRLAQQDVDEFSRSTGYGGGYSGGRGGGASDMLLGGLLGGLLSGGGGGGGWGAPSGGSRSSRSGGSWSGGGTRSGSFGGSSRSSSRSSGGSRGGRRGGGGRF